MALFAAGLSHARISIRLGLAKSPLHLWQHLYQSHLSAAKELDKPTDRSTYTQGVSSPQIKAG
jgi:hypothetical protein